MQCINRQIKHLKQVQGKKCGYMKNLCVRISERGYTLVIHSQQNKPNENKQNQVQAKLISLKCGYTCKLVE